MTERTHIRLCLDCRVAFKGSWVCPHCHKEMMVVRSNFHVPKKTDLKSWKRLKEYYENMAKCQDIENFVDTAKFADCYNFPLKMAKSEAYFAIENVPEKIKVHSFLYCKHHNFILELNPAISNKAYVDILERYATYGMVYESIYRGRRFGSRL